MALSEAGFGTFSSDDLVASLADCSERLETIECQQNEARRELDALGKPLISQTAPQF